MNTQTRTHMVGRLVCSPQWVDIWKDCPKCVPQLAYEQPTHGQLRIICFHIIYCCTYTSYAVTFSRDSNKFVYDRKRNNLGWIDLIFLSLWLRFAWIESEIRNIGHWNLKHIFHRKFLSSTSSTVLLHSPTSSFLHNCSIPQIVFHRWCCRCSFFRVVFHLVVVRTSSFRFMSWLDRASFHSAPCIRIVRTVAL